MQIKIKISRISYSDIAVAVLPWAKENAAQWGDSLATVITAVTGLPAENILGQMETVTPERVRELADAVPAEKMNKALSSLVAEYSTKLLSMVNTLSANEKLGIAASSFSLSEDLTAALEVSRIDYPVVIEKFLPAVKKSLLNAGGVPSLFRPMIEKASTEQICALLDRLPGDKDAVLAMLINQNQQKLITKIQDIAQENGIRLTVASLEVQA